MPKRSTGGTPSRPSKPPRPRTVDEYIRAAPARGRAHLRRMRAILREVAPHADEVIKWNTPFYVEPRFLFAFSGHKAHVNFAVNDYGLAPFRQELEGHRTTRHSLIIPYAEPIPEDLVRLLAADRVRVVAARTDTSFW